MYFWSGWHFFRIVQPDPHNIGAHLCQESKHVWGGGTFCHSCLLRCLKHFDPAVQKERTWACASICVLLPRLGRPQQEDVGVHCSTTQTNQLGSDCRARLPIQDPSVGTEPHECHLLPPLRVVRTERAWICWYSPMQIKAVRCTHTSALIHSSRLTLSFRKLEC